MEEVSGFRLEGDRSVPAGERAQCGQKEYDKVSQALREVQETDCIVAPQLEEMQLEDPELIKQGGRYGVRLKAKAPSAAYYPADIATEVTINHRYGETVRRHGQVSVG